jgi:predicted lipoprotein
MRRDIHGSIAAGLAILTFSAAAAAAELFQADSKWLVNAKMDVVVREVERRPRSSVVEIEVNSRGSSVGGSFFIMCSLRQLARLRGDYRHIVKVDDQPKPGQMLVGFLRSPDDDLRQVGPEFQVLASRDILHLDQFAELCNSMK